MLDLHLNNIFMKRVIKCSATHGPTVEKRIKWSGKFEWVDLQFSEIKWHWLMVEVIWKDVRNLKRNLHAMLNNIWAWYQDVLQTTEDPYVLEVLLFCRSTEIKNFQQRIIYNTSNIWKYDSSKLI